MTPMSVAVERRDLRVALSGAAGVNTVLDLTVDGTVYPAIVKELQRHPVRRNVIHVDFIQVRRGEKVHVQVPVNLVGEAPGVREGGIADQDLYQLNVEAEVTAVPEAVEADVSGLGIGDVLRVGDLKAPEGAVILDDPEAPVVSVVAPTVEPEPEVAEGAEEGEEAAAEGAEAATAEEAGEGEDRPEA